ncbi:hypothetical protein [Methylobacterium sp. JK268]
MRLIRLFALLAAWPACATAQELRSPPGQPFGRVQSWSPADGSGAGLTLTVQDATYVRRGRTCTVTFAITYPATSASNGAVLNNLPCAPASGTSSRFGGAASYTDAGFVPFLLLSGSAVQIYNMNGGGVSVSTLSGKSVRASLVFETD